MRNPRDFIVSPNKSVKEIIYLKKCKYSDESPTFLSNIALKRFQEEKMLDDKLIEYMGKRFGP